MARCFQVDEALGLLLPRPHELLGVALVVYGLLQQTGLLGRDHAVHKLADEMGRRGFPLPKPKTLANLNTLMGMLDAGIGITLLPRSVGSRDEGRRHVVVEIEGLLLRRSYGIALPYKAKLSTAAQSFCKFLRQAMNPPG